MTNAYAGFFLAYTGAPLSKTAEDSEDETPAFGSRIKDWGKGVYDDATDAWQDTPKGRRGGKWHSDIDTAGRAVADFGRGLTGSGIGGMTGFGISSLYGKIFDKPSLRRDIFGLVLGVGLGGLAGWHGQQGVNAWKNFRELRKDREPKTPEPPATEPPATKPPVNP